MTVSPKICLRREDVSMDGAVQAAGADLRARVFGGAERERNRGCEQDLGRRADVGTRLSEICSV